MWVDELRWQPSSGWTGREPLREGADLVIFFGCRDDLRTGRPYAALRAAYPDAHIIGASGASSILRADMDNTGAVAAAIGFERTRVRAARCPIGAPGESTACGATLGRALAGEDLAGVFVLADGLRVNGSGLAAGLNRCVPAGVPVFGGMAGNSSDHGATLVGADCEPQSGELAAIGLYGSSIRIDIGCAHGWDAIGLRRRITRSHGNLLYELDGKPALDLYKRYVGAEIAGKAGSQVVFPLLVSPPHHPEDAVVRSIVGVDEETGSLAFAGDMPQGSTARLMRGNFDRLSLAAADAARRASSAAVGDAAAESLAIIISCAGRLFFMGQSTPDELAAVGAALPAGMRSVGFYSFGEIAPIDDSGMVEVLNQTMTVATLREAEA